MKTFEDRLTEQKQVLIDRLIAHMKETKVSKADLARILGTSRPNVTQLLRSAYKTRLETILEMYAALGCTPGVFINDCGGTNWGCSI